MTLEEAREYVIKGARKGITCLACDQFAKVYKRKLNSEMARAMILIYKNKSIQSGKFTHLPGYLTRISKGQIGRGGDWAKLALWGLILQKKAKRKDGSKRVGFYMITEKGRAFAEARIRIPKYVLLYDGKFMGFSKIKTRITDSLGEDFDYEELMEA